MAAPQVVVPKIDAENYEAFLSLMDGLPATHAEWVEERTKEISEHVLLGTPVREFAIDPDEVAEFLARHPTAGDAMQTIGRFLPEGPVASLLS